MAADLFIRAGIAVWGGLLPAKFYLTAEWLVFGPQLYGGGIEPGRHGIGGPLGILHDRFQGDIFCHGFVAAFMNAADGRTDLVVVKGAQILGKKIN